MPQKEFGWSVPLSQIVPFGSLDVGRLELAVSGIKLAVGDTVRIHCDCRWWHRLWDWLRRRKDAHDYLITRTDTFPSQNRQELHLCPLRPVLPSGRGRT